MRTDLLTLLANHIEKNVKDEHFNMAYYLANKFGYHTTELSCGSVGCLLGHGSVIPELAQAGLRFVMSRDRTVSIEGDTGYGYVEDRIFEFNTVNRTTSRLFYKGWTRTRMEKVEEIHKLIELGEEGFIKWCNKHRVSNL